jgi:cyanophycinase
MLPKHAPVRPLRLFAALALLFILAWPAAGANGAPPPTRTLLPIGSGYAAATLQRFAQAAVAQDTTGNVELLVLPITFGTNANSTSPSERRKNLDLAETRRASVEAACNVVRLASQQCRAVLVPMLIRSDAFLQSNLDLFTNDVDGIYILGGDQTIAMQVIAETPAEQRLAALYAAGAVVGGNSAGAAVESQTMIAGYVGDNGPENGLEQGSVDLWRPEGAGDITRGLSFGIQSAILDQHVLQRGRIGRLINAAWETGLLGIGADADTGLAISNETLISDTSGRSAGFVVDLQTYAATGRYAGPTNSLAIRGVITHVLPTGGYGYDIALRRPTINGVGVPAPAISGRTFATLHTPAGAGPLFLGGDLAGSAGNSVADRFVAVSGGSASRIVVITAGYARAAESRAAAKAIAANLQTRVAPTVQWFVLDSRYDAAAVLAAVANANGIWLSGPDQSLIVSTLNSAAPITNAIRNRWQAGMPLLADNAAAAALGERMTTDPPAPTTTAELEESAIIDFRPDGVTIQNGLNWLPGLTIEPRFVTDRHWGRTYNLLANNPNLLGIGVDIGSAIELSATSATSRGTRTVLVFDGRSASFGVGANGALAARYVLLDTYVDGDTVVP